MEAFQGQYKDGTNGTRDFRMVSALYLVFRLSVLLAYSGNHESFDHAYGWLATAVVCISSSLFFAIVRPYKVNRSNTIDSVVLALLTVLGLMSMFVKYLPNQKYSEAIGVTVLLAIGIPHISLVLYNLYILSKKIRLLEHLKTKCRCLLSRVCHSPAGANNNGCGHDTDSLPDRLVNPYEYEPLIPAVNQRNRNFAK